MRKVGGGWRKGIAVLVESKRFKVGANELFSGLVGGLCLGVILKPEKIAWQVANRHD